MRRGREYRPILGDALEPRLALARLDRVPGAARLAAVVQRTPRHAPQPRLPRPAQVIDEQYASFLADFRRAEKAYLETVVQAIGGIGTVGSNLAQPYSPQTGVFVVEDGTQFQYFQKSDQPFQPFTVAASLNGVSQGVFNVGGVIGNSLVGIQVYDPATGAFRNPRPTDPSLPVGTTLQASVDFDPSNSTAAAEFQTYITQRLQEMAQTLVSYYNRLPLQLPRSPGPTPRLPGPRNAVQLNIFRQLVGASYQDSLLNSLLSTPLPSTNSPQVVDLYDETTGIVIKNSRRALDEAIRLTFRREDAIGGGGAIPTVPANARNS